MSNNNLKHWKWVKKNCFSSKIRVIASVIAILFVLLVVLPALIAYLKALMWSVIWLVLLCGFVVWFWRKAVLNKGGGHHR